MPSSALWSHEFQLVQWGIVVAVSLLAAVIDVRSHRIPNLLTGPLLLCGLIWSAAVGGWGGLLDGLAGICLVGLPFLALWLLNAGGAGDAKMMMALGAWLGIANGLAALLAVALAGGVVSLGYAVARRQVQSTAGNLIGMLGGAAFLARGGGRFEDRQESLPAFRGPQGIPYGVAIFLGTIAAAVAILWYRA